MNGYQKYSHVFQPLKVGNLILKNRIQFPPMVCCQSSAYGEVSQQYVDFIRMQARTGAALVTIGATPIDEETGQDYYGELNITDDAMLPGLSRIATAVASGPSPIAANHPRKLHQCRYGSARTSQPAARFTPATIQSASLCQSISRGPGFACSAVPPARKSAIASAAAGQSAGVIPPKSG